MAVIEVLGKTFLKLFKSSSERYVKKRQEFVAQVASLEAQYSQLTDAQLRQKTQDFRQRIQQLQQKRIGPNLRETLQNLQRMPEEARKPAKKELIETLRQCCDGILAEAFAAIREASDRHLGVRNVFQESLNFDPSILSGPMRQVFEQVKQQIADGANVHQIELPPEFYAEVRKHYDAAVRPPFRFRHFDVQMIGGGVLYEGSIAEMATGEGKTLVATLAAYIVALSGRKVHIITVNDYLAKRDRDWMGPVYEALGLTVGAIQADMDTTGEVRKEQYGCDITHGTNNEFGFDYLRDNMKVSLEQQVQGPLDFVIIDEVDSILIDEARTPLIISGPARDDVNRYKNADAIARQLITFQRDYNAIQNQIDSAKRQIANAEGELSEAKKEKDPARQSKLENQIEQLQKKIGPLEEQKARTTQYYEVEFDRRSVHLTHEGIAKAQDIAGVGSFYVGSNMEWPHLMEQALRAHVVFEREKDYVVQNDEVIIVDEFTGRLMQGRQWSDGLHQAVEAKEAVRIKEESQTLATITIQNFFKLYQQIAGMTGTAMTESEEFAKIYQIDVLSIPTNKPVIRDDREDIIYKTLPEKFNAIVDEIHRISQAGRPVLIGTISIEKSEALSAALSKRYGLEHEVLNAKQHAREAAIVAKAGHQHERRDGSMWGNVTIATNMAGRGTDIKLGAGVEALGGLHVLGTERHEARRIDNQLRGRSGRQGDKGSSQFFLSFDDDLLRIFMPEWILKALKKVGGEEGESIQHSRISKGVERAQKKVEERNFESRKSLLEYDEVMNYQRQVFYTRRQSILEGRGLDTILWDMIDEVIDEHTNLMLSESYPYECIVEWARTAFSVDLDLNRIQGADPEDIEQAIHGHARNNAEQEIAVTLGEYMNEDLPPEDWDLRGLSKWAMSRFEVNVSQTQLRKMSIEDVQRQLTESAIARIEKHDYSRLAQFFDADFSRKTLAEWINQKFTLRIKPEELAEKNPEAVKDLLIERAQQVYHRREIEYPVEFILNIALRRSQAGSSYVAKEIADWAQWKFRAGLQIEDVQQMSYDQIREKLLALNEAYLNDGRLLEEIRSAVEQHPAKTDLAEWANNRFGFNLTADQLPDESPEEFLLPRARNFIRRELTDLERYVLLQIYDSTWKDHLYSMDHLKGSVGLRGFAEKDPKMEYKREGFRMFQDMLRAIRDKVTDIIFKVQLESDEAAMRNVWNISAVMHADSTRFESDQQAAMAPQGEAAVAKTIKLEKPKVGRNDPCPCGSGKKYKKCCGLNA